MDKMKQICDMINTYQCKGKYDIIWRDNLLAYIDYIFTHKEAPPRTSKESTWIRNTVNLPLRNREVAERRYSLLESIFPGIYVNNASSRHINGIIRSKFFTETVDELGANIKDPNRVLGIPGIKLTKKHIESLRACNIKTLDDIIRIMFSGVEELNKIKSDSDRYNLIVDKLSDIGVWEFCDDNYNRVLVMALIDRLVPGCPIGYIQLYRACYSGSIASILYDVRNITKFKRNMDYVVNNTLGNREAMILRARFDLDNTGRILTLEDTSKKCGLNVSRSRIRELEVRALRDMRTPKRHGLVVGKKAEIIVKEYTKYIPKSDFKGTYINEFIEDRENFEYIWYGKLGGSDINHITFSNFIDYINKGNKLGLLKRLYSDSEVLELYYKLQHNPAVFTTRDCVKSLVDIPDCKYEVHN